MNRELLFFHRFYILAILLLILVITFVFFRNINHEKKVISLLALEQAKASHEKDLVYRRWVANYGGVYVPVNDSVRGNPFLNVPNKYIRTDSGMELTLINPAFMTRQVHELAKNRYRIKGHITSLNPLNPGNAPDAWEKKALKILHEGVNEYSSFDTVNNEVFLRFMRSMKVEKSCLKCHAQQGYSLGDIYGGISTSVPLATYKSANRENLRFHILVSLALFLVCVFIITAIYRYLIGETRKRIEFQQHIIVERIRAEEQERERYAKELHDGLGPLLSTCKVYFHTLDQQKGEVAKKKHIERAGELLEDALISIREISNNLSPSVLRKYGLAKALKTYIAKLKGVSEISFSLNLEIPKPLPEPIQFTLYRALIELINNSVKYANSSQISIQLSLHNYDLSVFYSDNGKGFDYHNKQQKSSGFGLLNLESRIDELGGKFEYTSAPDNGVQVKLIFRDCFRNEPESVDEDI